jgi:hypothetical protein
MSPFRLDRLQTALGALAAALFAAAIAALLVPTPAASGAAPPARPDAASVEFSPPLYVLANEPESALVERNPFESSRRPPARRRTSTSAEEEEAALLAQQEAAQAVQLVLLGTVIVPSGRNIAVIGGPLLPAGGNYHVGDEPLPGWRVTAISRHAASVVHEGRRIELRLQEPDSPTGGNR